jgi:hypothetical protein
VLEVAFVYWLLSGSSEAKERIEEIIDATFTMTFENPANSSKTCPAHSLSSHEGKGGDSLVCSPWMMALLSDALWRYWLETENKKAAALLIGFSEFIANHGFYPTELGQRVAQLPFYLVNLADSNLSMKNKWTDGQHACDVAGLLGKGALVAMHYARPFVGIKKSFLSTLSECEYLAKQVVAKHQKRGHAPVMPPRKFGWKYSTTAELPFFELILGMNER